MQVQALEANASEAEVLYKSTVCADLLEAQKLERCVASWGIPELEKLKKQIQDEKGDDLPLDQGDVRERVEREIEELEVKLTHKRRDIQILRESIKSNKDRAETLLAEFYR